MSSSHPLLPRDDIPVFNGDDDAYGWVLDIDKYFSETGISSTSKLLITVEEASVADPVSNNHRAIKGEPIADLVLEYIDEQQVKDNIAFRSRFCFNLSSASTRPFPPPKPPDVIVAPSSSLDLAPSLTTTPKSISTIKHQKLPSSDSEIKLQLINDHRTMPPRPPQPPDLQPLAFSAENNVVHLPLLDSQCRCLLDVRRNNPTKSPPPKPPDWNYNEVPSLLSEPPRPLESPAVNYRGVDSDLINGYDEYTDCRGRMADPEKHGGLRAATLACALDCCFLQVVKP